jgi:hypothetical protein
VSFTIGSTPSGNFNFSTANIVSTNPTGAYQWYLDANVSGGIDLDGTTVSKSAFFANEFGTGVASSTANGAKVLTP